ncbi:MAG: flagellar hook-length control protein FliK [Candidatus Eremiobacteraeota bacterium]|nr:flagellar hook-length control protein FliK [Candidatus Eremiobacteraeota bacterium]
MLDPLAALAAQAAGAAENALADATLSLGVSAEVLQAQISVGDLLTASVLPPAGGHDLLDILGQTVIAQLPTDVYPGEKLVLSVTGFDGNRIMVRNLGIADPLNPPSVLDLTLPQPAAGGSASRLTAILSSGPAAKVQPPASGPTLPPATPSVQVAVNTPPIAPPREVFVAASVLPQPLGPQAAAPPSPPAPVVSNPDDADAPVSTVEARIAAARVLSAGDLPLPEAAAPDSGVPAARSKVILPTIRATAQVPVRASSPRTHVQAASPVLTLLRSLRIPQTPLTLEAARTATSAIARFPAVLSRLQSALPHNSNDARIATLRTLVGFLTRLDPGNARVLPEQLSSFVNNVLAGAEAKLASLLRAHSASVEQAPAPTSHEQAAPTLVKQPAVEISAQDHRDAGNAPLTTLTAQAKAAERTVAIDHDLKTLVLSILRTPPAQSTPVLSQALNDTLTALTGAQFTTLAASISDPTIMTLHFPIVFQDGGQPAQVHISRNAPKKNGVKLDADNFHVAFVLDTKSLGTVAIDLETVGRAVKVQVNAEHSAAAERFEHSLGDLQGRLEQLRYSVSSIGARVAVQPASANEIEPAPPREGQLDIQA